MAAQPPAAPPRRTGRLLILFADALHNLLGGLAVGGAFVVDAKLGIMTWAVAAAHEVPQELGDFGVLVKSGWSRRWALAYNFASALTFVLGGVIAFAISGEIDVARVLPFAAGNFLYIGAADLIPQLRATRVGDQIIQFGAFLAGLALLLGVSSL